MLHDLRVDRMVGRTDALAELEAWVEDGERLVTLLGPGGIGKSRLAAELLGQLGGVFVALAERNDASGLEDAVVAALGLGGRTGPPLARLEETIRRRGVRVVILDNLEHLLPEARGVVHRLIERTREVTWVVTSRRAVELAGERRMILDPLAREDARTLLLDRAPDGADLPGPAVERLLDHLDGHPLALQLAAARLELMPAEELADRLAAGRLRVLRHPEPTEARHASLDALLLQAVEALPPGVEEALSAVAVFRGGAPLDALEALLGDEALDRLHLLVRRSLLRSEGARFTLLEPIQAWILGRTPPSELARLRTEHAGWYARNAPVWSTSVFTSGAGRQRVLAERTNLLTAHAHALERHDPAALDLIGALRMVLVRTMALDDQQALYDRTLSAFEPLPTTAAAARALHGQGYLALLRRHTEEARAILGRAEQIAAAAGDLESRLDIASDAVHADVIAGDRGRARQRLQAMIDLTDPSRHDHGIHARARLANMVVWEGHPERAVERLEPLGEAIGERDDLLAGFVAYSLARSLGDVGRVEEAERWWRRAVTVLDGLGAPYMLAEVRSGLAAILYAEGRRAEADAVHASARAAAEDDPDHHQLTWLIAGLADLLHGELVPARRALSLAIGAGSRNEQGRFQAALARAGSLVLSREEGAGSVHARELAEEIPAQPFLARPALEPLLTTLLAWEADQPPPAAIPEAPGFARLLARAASASARRLRVRATTVEVAADGSWLRPAGAERQSIAHRSSLVGVLARLASGGPATAEALIRHGWPDEELPDRTGRNRLYVALSTLRKLGVPVEREDRGYVLGAGVRVVGER